MTTSAPARPEPVSQPESDQYWEGARNGELWLQRDKTTGEFQFYPRAFSLATPGGELEWVKASGNATLHTFGIVHVPPHPAFAPELPLHHRDCGVGRRAKDGSEHRRRRTRARKSQHRHAPKSSLHQNQRRLHPAQFHPGVIRHSSNWVFQSTTPDASPFRCVSDS